MSIPPLRARPGASSSRGQLITVAAIILAVLFVGFAGVVNTVIFTENLATRADAGTSEAIEHRLTTRTVVTDTMQSVNYGSNSATYSTRVSAVESSLRTMQTRQLRYHLPNAVSTTGTVSETVEGVRVTQETPQELNPADPDLLYELNPLGLTGQSWLVARSVKTRQFNLRLDRSSLTVGNDTGLLNLLTDPDDALLDPEETFSVHIEDEDGDQWRVFVYRAQDNTDQVNVTVTAYTGGGWDHVGTCSQQTPNLSVGLTNATITGTSGSKTCPSLTFIEDVDTPYDIYYVNGDDVTGTYGFIADEPKAVFLDEIEAANQGLFDTLGDIFGVTDVLESHIYHDPPQSPYTTTAIYETQVDFRYATESYEFRGSIASAPGEPDYEPSAT